MQISTPIFNQDAVNGILAEEQQLAQTQEQLSTGLSINSPADNPVGEVQLLQLNAVNSQNTQYIANGQSANTNLTLEEQALSTSTTTLQSIRDLVVQANSGSNNASDLQDIATQISALESQLQGTANSQNAQGQFLFAGFSTSTQPFVRSATGAITYVGDSGSVSVAINGGTSVQTGDPGSSVFMNIPGGNGTFTTAASATNTGTGVVDTGSVQNAAAFTPVGQYTITFTSPTTYNVTDPTGNPVLTNQTYDPTQGAEISFNGVEVGITGAPAANDTFTVTPSTKTSVFDTLDNLVTALNSAGSSSTAKAQLASQLGGALQNIDQSLGQISNVSASVGARINLVSSVAGAVNANSTTVTDQVSDISNIDYAKVSAQYSQELVALQAAEQSYAAVDGLSLFHFLNGG
jgi:flagellar hook-associated protein 3 FlgL